MLGALQAAADHGLLPVDAAGDLRAGFLFLTGLRQHLRLRSTGSPTDLLPEEADELETLARSLGRSGAALRERYHTTTARVRSLFTRYFLDS
jgi:glutamine synthetase adenylyltransferase